MLRLVTRFELENHPELTPFLGGDRALQVGDIGAHDFAALKMKAAEDPKFETLNKIESEFA